MNKTMKTFTATTLAGIMALTTIAPGFASADSLSGTAETVNAIEKKAGWEQTGPTELDKIMQIENLSEVQFIRYGNFVKAQTTDEVNALWKGAIVKKAVKYMVDHSDIIPSKSLRNIVDKYGNKIIKAIDTAETYTWYGIAKALTKVGVPDKYADAIADFIVKFLL